MLTLYGLGKQKLNVLAHGNPKVEMLCLEMKLQQAFVNDEHMCESIPDHDLEKYMNECYIYF